MRSGIPFFPILTMSISIRFDIKSTSVNERVKVFFEHLTDRTGVNEAIGEVAQRMTKDHLLEISQYRHKTAEKLGGDPTNFLSKARDQTDMRADADSSTVTVRSPGIGRVAHDVEIVPTEGRQWLTLPTAAISYGRTVSQVEYLIEKKLFRPGGKANPKNVLATGDGSGGLKVYFALVEHVTQKQDRSLLPSDQAYQDAAKKGVQGYFSLYGY